MPSGCSVRHYLKFTPWKIFPFGVDTQQQGGRALHMTFPHIKTAREFRLYEAGLLCAVQLFHCVASEVIRWWKDILFLLTAYVELAPVAVRYYVSGMHCVALCLGAGRDSFPNTVCLLFCSPSLTIVSCNHIMWMCTVLSPHICAKYNSSIGCSCKFLFNLLSSWMQSPFSIMFLATYEIIIKYWWFPALHRSNVIVSHYFEVINCCGFMQCTDLWIVLIHELAWPFNVYLINA